jgi:glycosyltransferase involved in cell wall biosynthesis
MSLAQRQGMPKDTGWVANIHHGADGETFKPVAKPTGDYVACIGRIIESKGTHLAIAAIHEYNQQHPDKQLQLRLAGKHYSGHKDAYWQERIEPQIDNKTILYDGFISNDAVKQEFLANARAIIVPSTFQEPFGMVLIEALACGTPVIGLDSGAIPEVIRHSNTGFVVPKAPDEATTASALAAAIARLSEIERQTCRQDFEARFTLERMCAEHHALYKQLLSTG